MKPPPLLSVPEIRDLLESILPSPEIISVPLDESAGRTLAEPVRADRDGPPYDRVMMDGYALRAGDANPLGFRLSGKSVAGSARAELGDEPGEAVEVMTGAILPTGADAVVPYEWTEREGSSVRLLEDLRIETDQFIHFQGSDYASGDVLAEAGARLGPVETAIAATCGCSAIRVSKSPEIAVLSTGDELVAVSETPEAHQLRQSNASAVGSSLALAGFPPAYSSHLSDEAETPFTYDGGDEERLWKVEYGRDGRRLGIEVDLMQWKLKRRWTGDGEQEWPMLESPLARQTRDGWVEVGGATLECGKAAAWVLASPERRCWVAAYHGPEPAPLTFSVPEGKVEIESMGTGTVVWDNGRVRVAATIQGKTVRGEACRYDAYESS